MGPRKIVSALLITFLVAMARPVCAEPVRVLLAERPWEASIALEGFMPKSVLMPGVVLGGRTGDKIDVTVSAQQVEPGTRPAKVRKDVGEPVAARMADTATVESVDLERMAVLLFRWRNNPDVWSFHAYTVRADVAFDVHLCSRSTAPSRDQMLGILKSFSVKPSAEWEDMDKLLLKLEGKLGAGEKEKLVHAFLDRYPGNTWAHLLLAKHYAEETKDLDAARTSYAQALACHKTMPLTNPVSVWSCYDGLAACCRVAGNREETRRNLDKAYELAREIKNEPSLAAQSAYALAQWCAEGNDAANCVKFLKEAVQLDKSKKKAAQTDPAFKELRTDPEVKKLLGN